MDLVSFTKEKLISVTETDLLWHLDSGYVS